MAINVLAYYVGSYGNDDNTPHTTNLSDPVAQGILEGVNGVLLIITVLVLVFAVASFLRWKEAKKLRSGITQPPAKSVEYTESEKIYQKWSQTRMRVFGDAHSSPSIVLDSEAILLDLCELRAKSGLLNAADQQGIGVLDDQTDKLLAAYYDAHRVGAANNRDMSKSFTRQLRELQAATEMLKDQTAATIIKQFKTGTGFLREKYNGGETPVVSNERLNLTLGGASPTTASSPLPTTFGLVKKLLGGL